MSDNNPTWGDWLLAMRPKTLPAAIAPLLVAIALSLSSPYSVNPLLIVLALLCSLCLQILVNFANDYSDAQSGVDTEARIGPIRATQSGLISHSAMKKAIAITALSALLMGAPLILAGGWPMALIGLTCILAALAYSGGPYPLASHALGEFTVLIFFGFVAVVCGSYVFTGHLLPQSWLMALISGLPISAIMLVNNTRDMATDKPAGKNTLAVLLGRNRANKLYALMMLGPALLAALLVLLAHYPLLLLLAAIISWGFARGLCKRFVQSQGESLNSLLASTAQFSLINSLLFSAAILLAGII